MLIVDRLGLVLIAESAADSETTFQLYIDSTLRGKVSFLSAYPPGVSISRGNIAVWGGTRLYACSAAGNSLLRFDQDDEIHAAYLLDDSIWCLVREISVVVFDVNAAQEIARYGHDEILLDSVWREDRLIVRDLQNRELEIRIYPPDYKLIVGVHSREVK